MLFSYRLVWCHSRSSLYEKRLGRNRGVFTSFPPILLTLRCLNSKFTNRKTNRRGSAQSGEQTDSLYCGPALLTYLTKLLLGEIVGCLVNSEELEGILQEVGVVCFEVLSKCLHEGAEENH